MCSKVRKAPALPRQTRYTHTKHEEEERRLLPTSIPCSLYLSMYTHLYIYTHTQTSTYLHLCAELTTLDTHAVFSCAYFFLCRLCRHFQHKHAQGVGILCMFMAFSGQVNHVILKNTLTLHPCSYIHACIHTDTDTQTLGICCNVNMCIYTLS
jgi:hypothetical protein